MKESSVKKNVFMFFGFFLIVLLVTSLIFMMRMIVFFDQSQAYICAEALYRSVKLEPESDKINTYIIYPEFSNQTDNKFKSIFHSISPDIILEPPMYDGDTLILSEDVRHWEIRIKRMSQKHYKNSFSVQVTMHDTNSHKTIMRIYTFYFHLIDGEWICAEEMLFGK